MMITKFIIVPLQFSSSSESPVAESQCLRMNLKITSRKISGQLIVVQRYINALISSQTNCDGIFEAFFHFELPIAYSVNLYINSRCLVISDHSSDIRFAQTIHNFCPTIYPEAVGPVN